MKRRYSVKVWNSRTDHPWARYVVKDRATGEVVAYAKRIQPMLNEADRLNREVGA